MEIEQLERVILQAINTMHGNQNRSSLLLFSGYDRYPVEKFLVEAKEIAKTQPVKLAVDKGTRSLLPLGEIQESFGSDTLCCGDGPVDFNDLLSGVDLVVAGSLDLSVASKIARLIGDSLSARIVSECFIRGIRVVAVDFTKGITFANENYHLQVQAVKEILISFGMEFIPLDEIRLLTAESTSEADGGEEVGNIITEKFVHEFLGKELKITRDAVITPLAKDAIKERKIKLTRG